jgi:hypothetical protein
MAIRNPYPGLVLDQTGAAIQNAYDAATDTTKGTTFYVGRCRRVRFFVRIVLAGGSAVNSVNMKLQQRYRQDGVTLGWKDLPSNLDDEQGAAQPKGSTFEVEHTFAAVAGATRDYTFYLDVPAGLNDAVIECKANAAGTTTDSVKVYAEAA